MAFISIEAVRRMTQLIGDAERVDCKVEKLRFITCKLDEKEIEAKKLITESKLREYNAIIVYDFVVPFDNNLAERDLRMMKVQRKSQATLEAGRGRQHSVE